MPHTFDSRTYPGADTLMSVLEQNILSRDAFTKATMMNLQAGHFAVFDEPGTGVMLIVDWSNKMVHILTPDEARRANLPPACQNAADSQAGA